MYIKKDLCVCVCACVYDRKVTEITINRFLSMWYVNNKYSCYLTDPQKKLGVHVWA